MIIPNIIYYMIIIKMKQYHWRMFSFIEMSQADLLPEHPFINIIDFNSANLSNTYMQS